MTTILDVSSVPGLRRLYYLSLATAAAGACFCAVFVGILLYNYHVASHSTILEPETETAAPISEGMPFLSSDPSYRTPATDSFNILPTDHREFLALKRRLAGDRSNETLKEEIRVLDQKLRLDFFKRRETIVRTSPLLFIAALVFLVAGRTTMVLKRTLPVPTGDPAAQSRTEENRRLRLGLLTLVAFAMLLLGLALGLLFVPSVPFEKVLIARLREKPETPATVASETEPDNSVAQQNSGETEAPMDRDAFLLELQANWPSFRGFDGGATGRSDNPPVKWDATTDENLVWKTEIPLSGKSSPVVWKNRIFLSGADAEKRQVFCFDTESGKRLWTADAPSTPESAKPFEVGEDTGFAAPTMVVDGRRAFALFGNGDLVAVDFDGKVVWSKSLGIPESAYGFSSSPCLYFDRLIVQYDVGDGSDGKSKLYAFDVKTGNIVWETPREIPNSWSSPIVTKIGDRWQIVTGGDPFVIAYDPEDGKELWRCKCLGGDVGPSPTALGNVVYITNQIPRTTAIDATGSGDVTATHILWQGVNALPDTPSPIATERRFYTFDSHGYLTGYDPTNINEKNKRARYWELEVGGGEASFYSSPLLVGNLVYVFSMTEDAPKAYVIDLSKAETDDSGALTDEAAGAMVVAENPMPEPCVASPVVLNDKLYFRGSRSLFCVGR